jgi:predicted RNase H-like nuclease
MTTIAGLDGCTAGWVAIVKDVETGAVSWRFVPSLPDLLEDGDPPSLVGIDIPIGLCESGARPCDLMARSLLGPVRGASVFPAPVRGVLVASSYSEACRIRQAADGKKMSKQAWAIVPKIREVDELLQGDPGLRTVVREVHPEVSFYHLNGGVPVVLPKRSWRGMAERIRLLAPHFGENLEGALTAHRKLHAAADDVLDAFAALWSAERLYNSLSATLVGDPPIDATGLPMEINA